MSLPKHTHNNIITSYKSELEVVNNSQDLEQLKVKFLGKKGFLTLAFQGLKSLPVEEKKQLGNDLNEIRTQIEQIHCEYKIKFEEQELNQKLSKQKLDVTLPPKESYLGKTHPLTQTMSDVKKIFAGMGFQHVEGQEIEDDWHNFTALNFPELHPAREMQDTFYIDKEKHLLRTHTSTVQIRHMSSNKPPFRIISTGRVYRSDYDATHTPMFHQMEALYVDKNINMGHLKYTIEEFLSAYFGMKEVKLRMRPSYFPFTEPSAEVDLLYDRGKGEEWLEILGCGMVNPKVLQNVGIDTNKYQGFAFGVGIERLAMVKYNITDLRDFFEGSDLWNKRYGIL